MTISPEVVSVTRFMIPQYMFKSDEEVSKYIRANLDITVISIHALACIVLIEVG